ncbi:MAG: hypothetical protein GY696_35750 [Gammaproteobacteria bacterium]|nr:hypothetical protein [Gammaproteobacteria bacterium]
MKWSQLFEGSRKYSQESNGNQRNQYSHQSERATIQGYHVQWRTNDCNMGRLGELRTKEEGVSKNFLLISLSRNNKRNTSVFGSKVDLHQEYTPVFKFMNFYRSGGLLEFLMVAPGSLPLGSKIAAVGQTVE